MFAFPFLSRVAGHLRLARFSPLTKLPGLSKQRCAAAAAALTA